MRLAVVERIFKIASQWQGSPWIRRAQLPSNKPFVTSPVALRVRRAEMLDDTGVTVKSGQLVDLVVDWQNLPRRESEKACPWTTNTATS